ncbi:MAG TPA: sigma-54 dependent transcriptional regulator, partial [Candidatus Paceibacterota bacterium]|nr:sigma-54 dependent transcriptional regulator [Candidatus Paceibacterota bacterium]
TAGHEVHPFTNGQEAMAAMETIGPELVITDLYLEKGRAHGLDILQRARALNPPALVIVVTAFGSIETAVSAMKKGAYDYLEKPIRLEVLRLSVQRAISYNEAVSENLYLRKELRKKYQFNQIVGSSPAMQMVFRMVERVADTDANILILGESGTGKELVARALHFNSRRQNAPFIPVNCSALPENLLESELFGHRKGAFTGAVSDKKGLFHEADGGTIFLDEIAAMPPLLQSRLLRVLQEKEVRRVGDNLPEHVDVRILAATNESLDQKMKLGAFREDLFYRLNVISIPLPPLREREGDIPLLVSHFLRDKLHARTLQPFGITRQAMAVLEAHHWPGNVRELENAIQRACALSETPLLHLNDFPPHLHGYAGQVTSNVETDPRISTSQEHHAPDSGSQISANPGPAASPSPSLSPASAINLRSFLREQEMGFIRQILNRAEGDKEKAAEILGVSLATLYRKLAENEEA